MTSSVVVRKTLVVTEDLRDEAVSKLKHLLDYIQTQCGGLGTSRILVELLPDPFDNTDNRPGEVTVELEFVIDDLKTLEHLDVAFTEESFLDEWRTDAESNTNRSLSSTWELV